jgi:hypothetical protein
MQRKFSHGASFPVEMNSAIGRQNALAWSIDVAADIYLLRWEALARSCGGWFSIAGSALRAVGARRFRNCRKSVTPPL